MTTPHPASGVQVRTSVTLHCRDMGNRSSMAAGPVGKRETLGVFRFSIRPGSVEIEFFVASRVVPELDGPEVNDPAGVVDLLESDRFADQSVADEEPLPVPADLATASDLSDLEADWIFDRRQTRGVGSGRSGVEIRRYLTIDALIGSDVVVMIL